MGSGKDMGTEGKEDSNGTLGNDISHPQPISQLLFFQCGSKRVLKGRKLRGISDIGGKHIQVRIREERKHKDL